MPSRPVRRQLDEADLLSTMGVVRRYLAGLRVEPDQADEVVQESAARLWQNRWRIDRRTAAGYALATARSLLGDEARRAERELAHLHRLHEPSATPDAYETVELAQEQAALAVALAKLPARDQALLVAHHVDEIGVAELARRDGSSPGAVAAALNRARGRLRLEYCLQAHRRRLTEDRCRQVLTSVALGNLPRQQALGAGRHLAACEDCGPLAKVITARDRHSAGLGPLVVLVALLGWLRRVAGAHPVVASAGGAAGIAGGTAVALVLTAAHHTAAAHPAAPPPVRLAATTTPAATPSPPRPVASPPRHGLLLNNRNILPAAGRGSMLTNVGAQVRAVDVPVLAVDANEGFWIGTSAHRMWVQLATAKESKPTVRAGDLASFTGRIVVNPGGFTATVGLTDGEDADLVEAQKVHVEVPVGSVHLSH